MKEISTKAIIASYESGKPVKQIAEEFDLPDCIINNLLQKLANEGLLVRGRIRGKIASYKLVD